MRAADIRVFVVDDHPLVRSGVRLELEGRVDVVGTAGDVDGAATGIAAARPDVVLVDVHMPGGGGAVLIRRVLGSANATAAATADPVTAGAAVDPAFGSMQLTVMPVRPVTGALKPFASAVYCIT